MWSAGMVSPSRLFTWRGEDRLDIYLAGLLTLTWLVAMVSAAAEVKPAITGTEMKSIKKPSLRSAANQRPAFQLWTNQSRVFT